jgi:hypothetical protein
LLWLRQGQGCGAPLPGKRSPPAADDLQHLLLASAWPASRRRGGAVELLALGRLHHTHQRGKGAVQFTAVPRVPGSSMHRSM